MCVETLWLCVCERGIVASQDWTEAKHRGWGGSQSAAANNKGNNPMEWAPAPRTCSSVPRMFIPRILQPSYIEPLVVLKRTEKVFSPVTKEPNWKQWVEASYFKPSGATDSGYARLCIQDICWIFIFKTHSSYRLRAIFAHVTVLSRFFLFASWKMR